MRWARGLLQTARIHRDMFFNPRYGLFAFYLGINLVSMVLIPLLQLASLVILPILAVQEASPVPVNVLGVVGWLGLGFAFAASVFSIALDRAWKDLRHLYVAPLWVLYSFFMDAVTVWALILELRGGEARWNKLERTGVVSGDIADERRRPARHFTGPERRPGCRRALRRPGQAHQGRSSGL